MPRGEDEIADDLWHAFEAGVRPSVAAGSDARLQLEARVAAVPDEQRASYRFGSLAANRVLAVAAWGAGDASEAKRRAQAILAAGGPAGWDRGNALHEMAILLGRIAFEEGDLVEARRWLLEAGRTPGSPQLNSFGPDWNLARDLLDRGERDAVAGYLDLVERFWKSGADSLAAWRRTLKEGGTPDLPAVRLRAADADPTPTARSARPPAVDPPRQGIVGLWESMSQSRGGIGSAIQFRADGTLLTRLVVLVDGAYRIDGLTLVLSMEGQEVSVPLGEIVRDAWTLHPPGAEAIVKRRIGTAPAGASSVVGDWSSPHDTGGLAYERYRADGWFSFRLPMPGLREGRYEHATDQLRMIIDGKSTSQRVTVEGDVLRLVEDEGDVRELRYAGVTPWYEFDRRP